MKTGELRIKTPEGIVFSQSLAGPVTRCFAWLVDFSAILALTLALSQVVSLVSVISPAAAGTLSTLGYFVISFGYGIFLEWMWRGQTFGKKLFRLRVMDAEGMRLQFDQIVTRNLLRFVDMLPLFYFVGGITCWFSRKSQRLGDIAANTIVVRAPVLKEPDLKQLLAGKFNSLRRYPHLTARLRQRVEPEEAAAAVQALLRRDHFEPAARLELFAAMAAYFRAKVEFPEDAVEGVPDEQFVRNVVDVIYSM